MSRALFALALAGCPAKETDEPPVGPDDGNPVADVLPTPTPAPAADLPLATTAAGAVNAFGVDLHKVLVAADPTGNVFFSPASIEVALGMTATGAAGETRAAMLRTLHLEGVGHDALGALSASWNAGPDAPYELAVANRVWVNQGLTLGPAFESAARTHYGAGFVQMDLTTPAAAVPINGWVAEQTRDRIRDLVPPDVFTPDTRMVLTNAVYFKGKWKTQFDVANTRPAPFYVRPDAPVDAPLMFRSGDVTYNRLDGFQLAALPYEGDSLEMVILVPDALDGLPALEAQVSAANLDAWRGAAFNREVELFLPKFTLETSFNLTDALKGMGMSLAFSDMADFSVMSPDEALKIDVVLHKAFVAVDEAGTEAAAATAVVMVRATAVMEPEPTPVVRADRPFLVALRDVRTGALLFLGRVANPAG